MSLSAGKMYYSISEVCAETDLEQHVLRYWETEFPMLKPKKNRAGNRAYRKKEIELIKYIKYLLYEKQYTIQGAKKVLSEQKDGELDVTENEAGSLTIKKEKLSAFRDGLMMLKADIDRLVKNDTK
jgi:DNA-binding transcriptional MerR regulator